MSKLLIILQFHFILKEQSIIPDPEIVRQLTDMGFSLEGCKKAAFHTKNAGVEAAMNWVLEHSGDPDFSFPFVNPSGAVAGASVTGNSSTSSFVPDEGSVEQLINFGFTRPQCVKALKCTNGNMERAADWLFNHPDDTGKIILVFGAPVLKIIPLEPNSLSQAYSFSN